MGKQEFLSFGPNLAGALMRQNSQLQSKHNYYKAKAERLLEIGLEINSQKNTEKTLELLLQKCRELTRSDGGTLYMIERAGNRRILEFRTSQTHSKEFELQKTTIPLDMKTVAGTVALTGEPLEFEDINKIPNDRRLDFARDFEARHGYKIISILTVPIKDRTGQPIGVLQLINKKRDFGTILKVTNTRENVIPFTEADKRLVTSIAAQTGMLLEVAKLYKDMETTFDNFVNAILTAVEARDPLSLGHSKRVTFYALHLIRAINDSGRGAFGAVNFTEAEINEFRFASLLHDIGKIGVNETVLKKPARLNYDRMLVIELRLSLLHLYLSTRLGNGEDERLKEVMGGLQGYLNFIRKMSASNLVREDEFEMLKKISSMEFEVESELGPPFGAFANIRVIEPDEFHALSIRRGNLSPEERREIEDHVIHTIRIIKNIRKPGNSLDLDEIAGQHHERSDGSGYPFGLKEADIHILGKVLAIADIYDALNSDRHYRKALPREKTLEIMREEAEAGKIDKDIFELFVSEVLPKMPKEEISSTNI